MKFHSTEDCDISKYCISNLWYMDNICWLDQLFDEFGRFGNKIQKFKKQLLVLHDRCYIICIKLLFYPLSCRVQGVLMMTNTEVCKIHDVSTFLNISKDFTGLRKTCPLFISPFSSHIQFFLPSVSALNYKKMDQAGFLF